MVRIRIAKRRVEAYLMRYIIFYLLKKSNSFLEFFSFYFYITILMLYCQTNIDKMHKLLYIKNKRRLQAMKKFILGFITGGIICATATGFAVEYAVTANPFPVAVNGTETAIEGYNINDNTYFKLRDVADAVGGFNVGFSDNTITIDTDTAAQPTPTPTVKPYTTNLSPLPELPIEKRDGVQYVSMYDINDMLVTIGLGDYEFFGHELCKKDDLLNPILTDIPLYEKDIEHIPYDYYVSTIIPTINSLR